MPDSGFERSSLRLDVTTQEWVLFAPSRLREPQQLRTRLTADDSQADPGAPCPFCPGAEQFTPPEVYREPLEGRSDAWAVRVVPNRFPALQVEESPRRTIDRNGFEQMGGCGAHEVIIESPDHDRQTAAQPTAQLVRVLRAARARYHDLLRDQRFQAVVVFKNHGRNAGTALSHPHWQIIATAVIPPLLRLKHAIATDYFDRTGECLYCDLIRHEITATERIIALNESFAAVMPYASGVPFEIWILPRRHVPSFGHVQDTELTPLAEILRTALQQLHQGLENPDFNLSIDSVAGGDEHKAYFLWHIRILPRLIASSGFELGSGMRINTVLPEQAAQYLRTVARPPE